MPLHTNPCLPHPRPPESVFAPYHSSRAGPLVILTERQRVEKSCNMPQVTFRAYYVTSAVFPFLLRSVFAFGVMKVPGIYPQLGKTLFVTDFVLFAIFHHLGDFFLCHHGFPFLIQRYDCMAVLLDMVYRMLTSENRHSALKLSGNNNTCCSNASII